MPSDAEALRVVIGDDWAGRRADEAVLRSIPGFSRKEVKELFEAGRVRGSGRRLKKGDRVKERPERKNAAHARMLAQPGRAGAGRQSPSSPATRSSRA